MALPSPALPRQDAAAAQDIFDLDNATTVCPAPEHSAWHWLQATLQDAASRGCQHIHLEPGNENCRIRLRSLDRFEETLVPEPTEMLATIQLLRSRLWGDSATIRSPAYLSATLLQKQRFVEVRIVATTLGDTCLLTLYNDPNHQPTLDEIGFDNAQLIALREHLTEAPPGWLMVVCNDTEANATTVRAIAQELNIPDRKMLCAEPALHPSLPRITQLVMDSNVSDAQQMCWWQACQLNLDVALLAVPLNHQALKPLQAQALDNLLVVHGVTAQQPAQAIQQLLATGVTPFWIAGSVTKVIVQQVVRLLCPHCHSTMELDRESEEALHALTTPVAQDVNSWLKATMQHSYRQGEGCEHCHHTGHIGQRNVYDIVSLNPDIVRALVQQDIPLALTELNRESQLPMRVLELARRGEIALSEVLRIVRGQ
ncbi:MAG: ATPase, T2SS/T4P/T4SS family [Granulosicoccus sp.]